MHLSTRLWNQVYLPAGVNKQQCTESWLNDYMFRSMAENNVLLNGIFVKPLMNYALQMISSV